MKKICIIFLVLAIVFCFAACGNTQEEEELVSIGLSMSNVSDSSFITLVEGAYNKSEELGLRLTVVDSGNDPIEQNNNIDTLVKTGIKVLIVDPVDCEAVIPALNSAVASGVKVIVVNQVVNSAYVTCTITSNDEVGAQLIANYLLEKAGQGATCAELKGTSNNKITVDLGEGFHSIADNSLNIVNSVAANFKREEGASRMSEILQDYPYIDCVFAHNDDMALGALDAIGGRKVFVAGFGATNEGLAAIQAGLMHATVARQPSLIGSTAVEKALALTNGEEIESSISIDVELVTADNVVDFIKL